MRQNAFRDVQARGFLNFIQQAFTGNALADLLSGCRSSPAARGSTIRSVCARAAGACSRRTTGARSNALTLSAGLRYDYMRAAGRRRRSREPLRPGRPESSCRWAPADMPRGGYEARSQQHRAAGRVSRGQSTTPSPTCAARRLRHLLQPGGAGAVRGAVLQSAVFQSERLHSRPGLPPLTLDDPFPPNFPIFIPQSATAYQRDLRTPWMQHWNVDVQRQLGRGAHRSKSRTSARAATT